MSSGLFDDLLPPEQTAGRFAAPRLAATTQGSGLFDDLLPQQPAQPQPVDKLSSLEDEVRANVRRMNDRSRDSNRSFGAGLVRGGIGMVTLPGTVEQLGRMGYNMVAPQLGADKVDTQPNMMNAPYRAVGLPGASFDAVRGAVERNITGELHKPQTTAGEYAQTLGEFAPGVLFGGGGIGARLATNVAAPAVVSETAGQLAKGSGYEPAARVAGALAGGIAPQAVGRLVSPGAINTRTIDGAQRAANVQRLQDEGVTLMAGDRSGNRFTRWAESAARDTFGSSRAAERLNTTRAETYTQAALRRAGIDAPRATPETIEQGFRRVGSEFDEVGRTAYVGITPSLARRAQTIAQNYADTVEPAFRSGLLQRVADDVQGALQQSGQAVTLMQGPQYLTWRSQIGEAARGASDSRTSRALYEMQRLLDTAAAASLRAQGRTDMVDRFRTAREQYRNLLVVSRARAGGGEDAARGLLSPAQLKNATRAFYGEAGVTRNRSPFGELVEAGEATIKQLPQSGTAPRAAVQGALSAGGAAIGAGVAGVPGGVAGAFAPMLMQGLSARALVSRPGQAWLGNQMAQPLVSLPSGSPLAAALGGFTGGQRR